MRAGFTCVPNYFYESELWLFSGVYDRRSASIDLMGMARIKDEKIILDGEEIEVKRGSVLVAQTTLALRWKWSRKKVYNFLKELEKNKHATISKQRLFTVISFPFLSEMTGQKIAHKHRTNLALINTLNDDNDQVVTEAPENLGEVAGQKTSRKPRTIEDRIYNNNTYSGVGCGENQKTPRLRSSDTPPLTFSDDDFPDFEEIAPKTEVIDDFPDSPPAKTPPPPSAEKPVEWPDNPTEGALFKKEELPSTPKKSNKTPDLPEEPKLEVRKDVWLTKAEAERFRADFPDKNVREYYASMLADYKQDNPNWAKKRRSDNRTLRNWIRRDQVEGRGPFKAKPAWQQQNLQQDPQRPRYKTAEETREMLLKQLGITEGH